MFQTRHRKIWWV